LVSSIFDWKPSFSFLFLPEDHVMARFIITILAMLHLILFSLPSVRTTLAAEALGLDTLVGGQGRAKHLKRIGKLVFENGKTYTWEDFSNWGRELFNNSFVQNPPMGAGPSERISQYFKCSACHNDQREDPDITVQDPEARFRWIEETGKEIYLLQGATMWGLVNRVAFYNGYFETYHDLCVPKGKGRGSWPCGPVLGICAPGCRSMNPTSVEDAVQVCAKYCGVGRYLDEWELCALLAFFWDQEVQLNDLDISVDEAEKVKTVLAAPSQDPQEVGKLRGLWEGKYAKEAGNTFRVIPEVATDADRGSLVAAYRNGSRFVGESARGERLYPVSCGRCHGTQGMPFIAEFLGGNPDKFYKTLANGTAHRGKPYMPNFTLERLSRQQAADILQYLQHIKQ
jgi:mono/diheme cytochrome c family protein